MHRTGRGKGDSPFVVALLKRVLSNKPTQLSEVCIYEVIVRTISMLSLPLLGTVMSHSAQGQSLFSYGLQEYGCVILAQAGPWLGPH